MFFFWVIFVTLMLPVEVRIVPTYGVVAELGMLNSYAGLIIPADRLGDRHLPVPPVLPDRSRRARRGGADRRRRPDALLPRHPAAAEPHHIAALFVIQFIYGWNQYLWPLLITTEESYYTVVMAVTRHAQRGRRGAELEPR